MAAALVDIGKAVASDLANGHLVDAAGVLVSTSGNPPRLSQALTVVRAYVPRFRPPDQGAGQWQVIVSSEGEQPTRIARDAIGVEYTIQIGICGKLVSVDDVDVLDGAMQLLQEMGDLFFDFGLTGSPSTWVRNEVLAWPDRDMLLNGDLFALWNAVFQGSRTRIH